MIIISSAIILTSWPACSQPSPGAYPKPGFRKESGLVSDTVLEFHRSLGWIKSYAEKLEKSHGDRLPQTREPLQQIQNDAKFLQQKWLDWAQRQPRSTPYASDIKLDLYFHALQGAQKQLKDLHKNSDEIIVQTVKDVAADLHAKAENCRHSADGLGKEINVKVRTKKGTEEIPGYEVWCSPIALFKFKNEHKRFPKISSPTVLKNMAPGCYVMWLEKGKEKIEPVTQIIGGHGETELEVDLLVFSKLESPK